MEQHYSTGGTGVAFHYSVDDNSSVQLEPPCRHDVAMWLALSLFGSTNLPQVCTSLPGLCGLLLQGSAFGRPQVQLMQSNSESKFRRGDTDLLNNNLY